MDMFYRFSESPIWKIQKDYYQQLGIETWGKAMVPFTATTNSFVANGYAQTIQAFILDLERNKQLQLPINIVELGTGHGRFSFMLMKALYEIYRDYETKPFRYIMTDIAPVSIEAWRQHPKLAQYIEDGTLDFAQFDAVTQEDTPLEVSGHSFKETLTDTPLVLVANFILDVLPYDLFKISEGALSQCNVAVHLKNDITFEHPPAEVIKNIELEQQFIPCGDAYYDDNKLNKILDDYKEEIEDSVIQLPINAIKSINYFNRLSNCNLWLIAEEATTESENLDGKSNTGIKKEGSFTTRVNLHCVKKYLENTHSRFLSPDHPDPRFDSYAILNGTDVVDYALTSNSFMQTQNLFGPRSFFRFFVSLSREKVNLSDDGILSLLELSKYDPYIVYRFHDEILNACLDSKGFKREALQLALTKTWDNYYDIGEEYKQAYYLGRMIRRLGNYQQAIKFFQLSLQEREGESHKTHYWLGRTFLSLKNITEAQEHFKTSIQLGEGQKNDNHTTYYWLGRSALLIEDRATAEESFKQSLQLSRKHESSIKTVMATAP